MDILNILHNEKKIFNDSIHGHIELHPLCISIIDTIQFQRLRRIKQLGVLHYLYPGANHTRFEHSLGVCHLAGLLIRALRERQGHEINITDNDILCVEIAGLCHDLGHGPFSHVWEVFMKEILVNDSNWKHEQTSICMFDHLLKSNNLEKLFHFWGLNDQDIVFIKEQIAGPIITSEEWPYKGRSKHQSFLYDIVANKRNGIDVDKWDYFLRDCHHIGFKTSFDYNRLMKFARIIYVDGDKTQICFRDKSASSIYEMFYTRYLLHYHAYQHKLNIIIETMLVDGLLKADSYLLFQNNYGIKVKMSEAINDMHIFTMLTDSIFDNILCSTIPNLKESKLIFERILNRKFYSYIGQIDLKLFSNKLSLNEINKDFCHLLSSDFSNKDITFKVQQINFGMEDKCPLDLVGFYRKKETGIIKDIHVKELPKFLPEYVQDTKIYIICKLQNEKLILSAKEALQKWYDKQIQF